MTAAREHVLADLRDRIASLEGSNTRKNGVLPFGIAEMDAAFAIGFLLHPFDIAGIAILISAGTRIARNSAPALASAAVAIGVRTLLGAAIG